MIVKLIQLTNTSIYEQLMLEESLLRAHDGNFWILNTGAPRAIVMGSSGKKEELIDLEKAKEDKIPLIRRFSGGGTVIIDEKTLFSTFIFSNELLNLSAFPDKIMKWSASFYKKALKIEGFDLKENDYAINDQKCTGNAQYFRKNRFLHHSSFLWDFDPDNMKYLLHPKKTPQYRLGRSHLDFICSLKSFIPSKQELMSRIILELQQNFTFCDKKIEYDFPPHRKTTELILF